MRLIIATILGGIVMFGWGALSHMVLGLETKAVKTLPNEAPIAAALKSNISEPGFYFLPGYDTSRTLSAEEQTAWMEKYAAGPNAILIYHPAGTLAFSPKQFGTQFGADIAVALVLSIILMFASVGFVRGLIISTLVGIAAWIAILVPYWNWYRFPDEFVLVGLIDQAAGFFLAGLVIA